MMVDSSATSGRPAACAAATGALRVNQEWAWPAINVDALPTVELLTFHGKRRRTRPRERIGPSPTETGSRRRSPSPPTAASLRRSFPHTPLGLPGQLECLAGGAGHCWTPETVLSVCAAGLPGTLKNGS